MKMRRIIILTQGTESRTLFLLLLLPFCIQIGFGYFFPLPAPDMIVLCGVWLLVMSHTGTRMLSQAFGTEKGAVLRWAALSRDQARSARNLATALGLSGLLLAVSITSHWLNGTPLAQWRHMLQWMHVLYMVLGIGTFLAVQLTMSSHRRVCVALSTIVFFVWVSSSFALYDVSTEAISPREAFSSIAPGGDWLVHARFSGLAYSVSILASHLAWALPIALSLLLYVLYQRHWWRGLVLAVVMVILLLAMVHNTTRSTLWGSTAGFALVATLFVLHTRLRLFARTVAVLAITMIPLCTTGMVILVTAKHHRIFNVTDANAHSRLLQIRVALHHALEDGSLLGSAPHKRFSPQYVRRVLGEESEAIIPLGIVANISVHNDFIEVLVLYGPMGLTLLLVFWLTMARAGWHSCILTLREREPRSTLLTAATLGGLVSMFVFWKLQTTGPFTGHPQGWTSWFIVGLVFASERILAERQTSGIMKKVASA